MNSPIGIAIVFCAATFLAWLLTAVVRRYALSRDVLDVPNERSAHIEPTPRGGGLAVVTVVSAGILVLHVAGLLTANVASALLGGSLLIAVVGWLDDRGSLKASLRAFIHCVAAIWAVWWLGGFPAVSFGRFELGLGAFGFPLAAILIMWLINLYNFMDGIDGIAGVNALTVSGFAAALLFVTGSPGLALLSVLIGGASLGFLLWNWPPARIFLGDSGSGTLGFYFGVLAVASENSKALPLAVWMLLLGVFMVDSTLTLVRRLVRGEQWYEAHNKHAYQRAVRAGYSHATVSIGVALINIALGICASTIVLGAGPTPILVAVAFTLLVALYVIVERIKPMAPRPRGPT